MAFGLGMRLGGASASSPTVAATRVSSSRQAQRSSFSAAPLPARVSVAANVSTTTDRAVLRSSLDLSLQVLALQQVGLRPCTAHTIIHSHLPLVLAASCILHHASRGPAYTLLPSHSHCLPPSSLPCRT